MTASFAPFLLAVTIVGAIVTAAARQWILLGIGAGSRAGRVGVRSAVGGRRVGQRRGADRPTIRVMQSNIMVGSADPTALVQAVRDQGVDVLTLQELTEPAVAALRDSVWKMFCHTHFWNHASAGTAAASTAGFRFPTVGRWRVWPDEPRGRRRCRIRRAGGAVRRASRARLHRAGEHWTEDFDRLRDAMDAAAVYDNVIVSGDFNATYSHRKFRDLRHGGYVDAADQLGAGILPTYPTDKRYPAIVESTTSSPRVRRPRPSSASRWPGPTTTD
ncbi:endonuclease/exonuclease/phosphatase family protein [Rhodococcus hoagii]|nr:endonuclease/exonuclease/phosphatase family protein [Prescottella equi]